MLRKAEDIYNFLLDNIPEELLEYVSTKKIYYLQKEESGEIFRTIFDQGSIIQKRKYIHISDFDIDNDSLVIMENKEGDSWYLADVENNII